MILGIFGRAQRRRIISVNLRMLKTEWMHWLGIMGLVDPRWPHLHARTLVLAVSRLPCLSITWSLSPCGLSHTIAWVPKEHKQKLSGLFRPGLGLTAFLCCWFPKWGGRKQRPKLQVGLPKTYFFLCLCWYWAGAHMPLSGNLEGQGAKEGQIQVPGSQLSSVYVGCIFSMERHKLNLFHR